MTAITKDNKTPRYAKVAEQLRRDIRAGKRSPGDRLPSFHQMRTQFGVTQGILERAYGILEEDGLIERQSGRGTFVTSPKPRALTSVIGLAGPPVTTDVAAYSKYNPFEYWAPLMAGIQSTLLPANQRLMLLDCDSPTGWDALDGLLLFADDSTRALRWVSEELPVVSLLHPAEGLTNVVSDDAKGVRQAVEYLVRLGHRRIAYLIEKPTAALLEWRLLAYHAALRAEGIKERAQWVRHTAKPQPEYREWGHEAMRAWLREDWKQAGCTALLTQNDATAIGAMHALQEAGVKVPGDVSVIGFDNSMLCDYGVPSLTSVEIPLHQIGKRGSEILLQQIHGERPPGDASAETISLPTCLEVRRSTAPARKKNV